MAKKKIGHAKPGTTVTRKSTMGKNKGDTVRFKANSSSAKESGKLKPRRIVKDVGTKNTSTIPTSKKPIISRKKARKK